MANKGYGNFAFLYDINKDLYNQLFLAEKNARIDVLKSGNDLRKALEKFIKIAVEEHGLKDYVNRGKGLDLFTCIERMTDVNSMRLAGYLKSNQTFQDKPLLPPAHNISYTKNNGTTGTSNVYNLIRMTGNAGSHIEQSDHDPKLCFDTICKALSGMYKLLRSYYKDKLPKNMPGYNKNEMPIGDFIVTNGYAPKDQARSKCRMEFIAHTVGSDDEPEFHALLRMYERKDLDRTFMLRNRECFVEASKASISSVPDGMTRLRELTGRDNKDGEYYIIAYIFNRDAKPLDNDTLRNMTMAQRLELCARLVRCMDSLHNSASPIYHRLLTHECIYVSQFREIWIPYIIKLDYAKIAIDTKGTVIAQAAAANAIMQELALNKFIPPEWQGKDSDATDVDWAKVDVFSLGVLIGDILNGQLGEAGIITSSILEDQDVPPEILDLLDRMQTAAVCCRCSVRDARNVFDRVVR